MPLQLLFELDATLDEDSRFIYFSLALLHMPKIGNEKTMQKLAVLPSANNTYGGGQFPGKGRQGESKKLHAALL